jgi:hypothetical protein
MKGLAWGLDAGVLQGAFLAARQVSLRYRKLWLQQVFILTLE